MKRRYLLKIVCLMGFVIFFSGCTNKEIFDTNKETLNMVVASDFHYLLPEYYENSDGFREAMLYADGKMTVHSEIIVNAFIEQMKAQQPDLVLIAGDLTFNGEKASHEAMAHLLKQLKDENIAVALTNGNHDIENWTSASYRDNEKTHVDTIDMKTFKKIYKDLGFQYAKSEDEHSLSYYFDLNQKYSLVVLDSCNDFLYQGGSAIKEETMNWLETTLKEIRDHNHLPLVMMHHNLAIHNDLLYKGYTVTNQERLVSLFTQYQVPLVLSGHIHLQSIANVEGIYDIATASLSVSPMQYGVLTLKNDAIDYQIKPLNLDIDDEAYFEDVYFNKVQERLLEVFDENQVEQVGKFLSKVNRYYFSGLIEKHYDEIINDPLYDAIIEKANKLEFSADYLESQLAKPNNDLEIHIEINH